jgi:uncharacterized membrane protein
MGIDRRCRYLLRSIYLACFDGSFPSKCISGWYDSSSPAPFSRLINQLNIYHMEDDFLKIYSEETKRLLRSKSAMDTTRNISITILLGMILISFASAAPVSYHVPLFASLAVFVLLLFETWLFCSSFISERRVRLLEKNFIAPMFDGQVKIESNWQGVLSGNYVKTSRPPLLPSIAFRIYKNYFILYLAVDSSWLAKVYLSPEPPSSFSEFVSRLDLGVFVGWATVVFVVVFWLLFVIALIWVGVNQKKKEYLHGY